MDTPADDGSNLDVTSQASPLQPETPQVAPEVPPPSAAFSSPPPSPDSDSDYEPFSSERGGWWTIPLLCAGIGLIACCLLIPQADKNRQLAYEKEKLRRDLDQLQRQIQVNDDFLKKIAEDPNLTQRLAQRQMKVVREGSAVLEFKDPRNSENVSPFLLTHLPPPDPLPSYQPVGGRFAAMCRNAKTRLRILGVGLMLVAAGMILGGSPRKDSVPSI